MLIFMALGKASPKTQYPKGKNCELKSILLVNRQQDLMIQLSGTDRKKKKKHQGAKGKAQL